MQIKFNGTEVWLLAGQSNTGRALVSEMTTEQSNEYAGAVANTKIFNPYRSLVAVEDLNIGLNTTLYIPFGADEFGCEAALFNLLQESDPKERYLLKFGYGGTSMESAWGVGLDRYVQLETYLTNFVKIMVHAGKRPYLRGFIWMQGESDAASESTANAYFGRLGTFFNGIKEHWDGLMVDNNLPVHQYKKIIGRINGPDNLYRDIVRTAQADYCAIAANNAILIDTDNYPLKDHVHYAATGQVQFGIDIYNALN